MAQLTVPYTSFEEGRFPPVCCKTGAAADRYARWRFVQSPLWTWILLPFGVLPFLIARWMTTKEFHGVLPITVGAERRVRRLSRAALAFALAGVAAFFGAYVDPGWAGLGLGLLVIAGVLLVMGYAASPGARRDSDHGTVELRNVDAAFIQAVEASWSAPPPAP